MTHVSSLWLASLIAISVSLITAEGARAGESSHQKGMSGGGGEFRFVLKAGARGLPYPIPNRANKGDRERSTTYPEARVLHEQYMQRASYVAALEDLSGSFVMLEVVNKFTETIGVTSSAREE